MSKKLIDAGKLKKDIKCYMDLYVTNKINEKDLKKIIDGQEKAFDKEKVLKEIDMEIEEYEANKEKEEMTFGLYALNFAKKVIQKG